MPWWMWVVVAYLSLLLVAGLWAAFERRRIALTGKRRLADKESVVHGPKQVATPPVA